MRNHVGQLVQPNRDRIIMSRAHSPNYIKNVLVNQHLLLRGGEFEAADDEDEGVIDDQFIVDENQEDSRMIFVKFANSNLGNAIRGLWRKTPPITQVYLGSAVLLTVTNFFLNGNHWPEWLSFQLKSTVLRLQVWRFFTGFLFLGQLDIFYPLTIQFVWQHMAQLERLHYKQPEEFIVLLLFGMTTLIAVYQITGISTNFLGHNLATYLVYIWSRLFEGLDVNFLDIIMLKSEMLPWFFCAQTWVLEQQLPFADLIGIGVGHLYWYLRQRQLLHAPSELSGWFQRQEVKNLYAQFREDFE